MRYLLLVLFLVITFPAAADDEKLGVEHISGLLMAAHHNLDGCFIDKNGERCHKYDKVIEKLLPLIIEAGTEKMSFGQMDSFSRLRNKVTMLNNI